MKQKIISSAPGRICLFGDHQDYLELPVIACAINRYITVEAKPNKNAYFKIMMSDLNKEEVIHFDQTLQEIQERDYLRIALKVLRRYGCVPNTGFDMHVSGTIPINAGLSSSSALTVAWIHLMATIFGINEPITPQLIARLAYETEVLEHASSGGKMDQYTISMGNTIFLDTRNDKIINLKNAMGKLIVGVSGEAKDTLGTLSKLKNEAHAAIRKVTDHFIDFDIHTAEITDLSNYSSVLTNDLKPIFQAAIENHEITRKAYNAFNTRVPDLEYIGNLMNRHHELLKNNLKITTPRIDKMIDKALKAGAYGAKIVGSGGGGCIVAIGTEENEERIINAITEADAVDAFSVNVSRGASIESKSK